MNLFEEFHTLMQKALDEPDLVKRDLIEARIEIVVMERTFRKMLFVAAGIK